MLNRYASWSRRNKTILYDEHHRDDRRNLGIGRSRCQAVHPDTQHAAVARSAPPGGPLGAEMLPLYLMRLENVRSFASAVDRELGPAQINSLVLNAGLLFPNDDTRSADGFEAAFAVNHLAHYLLLRLLLPRLAQGATVILTTSGAHDPAEKPSSRLSSVPMRGFSRTRSATLTAIRTR
jgi:NAD(P)-dependent dehydrogenase (short-subunit alcohol dehydrogenase family)